MEPARDAVLAALAGVIDPELRRPVAELDVVGELELDGGRVSLTIALTVAGCPLRGSFEQQVPERVCPPMRPQPLQALISAALGRLSRGEAG